jgi:hypothetical protein
MAGRKTGEAKIWLALGLFVTGLAIATPTSTMAAVDKPLATQIERPMGDGPVKTAAEVEAQSADVIPVAKRISPIGKTLADLRGAMPHYLGSNTSGEMFWYSGGIVVKSTATGPISLGNYDLDALSDISPNDGFIDQSGNLYTLPRRWDSCQIVKLVPGSTVPIDVTKSHGVDDYDCGRVSPTDGVASGKELLESANLAFDASGNIYFHESSTFGQKIRKIDTSTGLLSTVGGTVGLLGGNLADGSFAT